MTMWMTHLPGQQFADTFRLLDAVKRRCRNVLVGASTFTTHSHF